ncbi:MAG: ABC transporter permease [Dehalococcoidales bacterium]|jgi:ABC-2 type transport system permease protein
MIRWRIITATVIKELKTSEAGLSFIFKFVNDAGRAAALAWIIYQSGNLESLGFLTFGVALIAVWTGTVAEGGWALETELAGKTLDFTLISRTSMALVLFSKMLAQIIHEVPTGIVAAVTVMLVAHAVPDIADPAELAVSLLLVIAGLSVVSTFLGALVVLAGARAGVFMGIVPFGAVLSGFILPVGQLPLGLEILARFMPSSWAMDGAWNAITGTGTWAGLAGDWLIAIGVGAAWFLATVYLCRLVDKRIRIEGSLSAY